MVPVPGSLAMLRQPPTLCMKARTCANPIPVPFSPLVVKNGSSTFSRISWGMPQPWSLTRRLAYVPGAGPTGPQFVATSRSVTIKISPPPGMASRAIKDKIEDGGVERCRIDQTVWDVGIKFEPDADTRSRAISKECPGRADELIEIALLQAYRSC